VGEKLRLVIADDHPLVLDGLRRALADSPDIEIVGQADSGPAVLPLVDRVRPHMVLMDMRMPRMDGLACLDQLRKRHPAVRVVILSAMNDDAHVQAALKRGASGYMLKSVNPADLAPALRAVAEGTVFYASGAHSSADPNEAGRSVGLTDRETEILRAVARGMTTESIGRELWVSVPTVKFHLRNLYRKLGVKNRTCAARWAYDNGLVSQFADSDAPQLSAH
jgi:DNA-binding NarL/FixJ family response regulator